MDRRLANAVGWRVQSSYLEGGQHEGHVSAPGDQAEGDGAVRSEHAQSLQADAVQLLVEAPGVQAGHEQLGRVHGQVVLQQTQRLGLLLAPPHLLFLLLVFVQQVLLDRLLHRLFHLVTAEVRRQADGGNLGPPRVVYTPV